MNKPALVAALAAFTLSLSACGGGGDAAGENAAAGAGDAGEVVPGQPVNAADGINATGDASGTTGSSTGDAGGPLPIANDAAGDAAEANGAAANTQ